MIGLGHKARHGKDTAAAAIVKACNALRVGFADDLYAVARVLYGMTTKDAPLLQFVGVHYRETISPDVWIRAVYAKLLDQRPRLAVIPDVRFKNELAFIKALGGVTVKVERYTEHGTLFVDPSRPATHISETALDGAQWDVVIRNAGSVLDLQDEAVMLADRELLMRAA